MHSILKQAGVAIFFALLILLAATTKAQNCAYDSVTFNYTNGVQTFVVPSCVTSITVRAWGAGGGGGGDDCLAGAAGGGGAYASDVITVVSGQNLSVIIGGGGLPGGNQATSIDGGPGGYGYGNGGSGGIPGPHGYSGGGGGGGGGTAILNGVTPLVVAGAGGGGAGAGCNSIGGAGGGGGQNGFAGTAAGGIAGGSINTNGVSATTVFYDAGGGGGGGGGLNGGDSGSYALSCDCGGGGGGGGNNLGSVIFNGNGTVPGDNTYASLPAGIALGGPADAGWGGQTGGNGYMVIIYCIQSLTGNSNITGTSCSGGNNGTATVTPTSGLSPFTYLWSPSGQTNATATGLSAGTYSVSFTDNNGCTGNTTVVITQPAAIRDSSSALNHVPCQGGLGSATIGVLNGTGPYTYLWSPGGGTNATETGLSSGTYTVTVTDANGCAGPPAVITVSQPENLTTYIESRVIVQCEEYGYITAHAAIGGVPPYTYSWAPGGGSNRTTVTTLTAGSYTVTVTDSNGCTATASESISYPPRLLATANLTSGTTCYDGNNGSASVIATGGTMPYTYSWFPSGGTKATASGLSAGTYTITVTDSAGCQYPVSLTVTEPAQMVITTDTINVMSTNGCNGQASVTVVSGGTPPYTYSWSPGGQTTATITGLCQGDYCCTITQANGCSQDVCLIVLNTTGINNLSSGNGQISIYPNPNKGIFTIQTSAINGQSSVEIYNVLGEKVYSQFIVHSSSFIVNLSQPSGIYFYRVMAEDGNLLGEGKVLIEK